MEGDTKESSNNIMIVGKYEVDPNNKKEGRYTTVYKAAKDTEFTGLEIIHSDVMVEERDEILKKWSGKGTVGSISGSTNYSRYEMVGTDTYYFVHTERFEDIIPVEL